MRITVGDVALYFDVDGSALRVDGASMADRPTVVLLHGGPGADHSLFKPELAALTDAAQVIYLDQRGSGRSDRGHPSSWTWTQWADDVAAFCRTVDIARPVLLGVSSGALVALACAARHPGLVAGLVLDSPLGVPTSLPETLEVFERRGGAPARAAAERYLAGDTSDRAAADWRRHALPLYGDKSAEVRRQRAIINEDVQAHFRTGACGSTDTTDHAATVTCPTLILAGEDDPVVPAAATRRFAASFTRTRVTLEILPGVGHGTFRQATAEALAHTRDLIRRTVQS